MADLTKVTTIADNTREVVMAFQYQYVDTGNESAVSKIDVSALAVNADGETCTGIRIVECWWVISAMTVEILADADTDIIVMHLTEGQSGYQDFSKFGGLSFVVGCSSNSDNNCMDSIIGFTCSLTIQNLSLT